MKQEQQQQAENLYFQTDLSNAQIAAMLGISPRTLQYWISDHGWDRLKTSAKHMPLMLAENCYFIMAHLQRSILAEGPAGPRVITAQEVNMLSKLANTIHKLRTRATLNESLEMLTHFMEHVATHNPDLVDTIRPVVDDYVHNRATGQAGPGSAPRDEDRPATPPPAPAPPAPQQAAEGDAASSPAAMPYTPQARPSQVQHSTAQQLRAQGFNRAQRRQMARNAAA